MRNWVRAHPQPIFKETRVWFLSSLLAALSPLLTSSSSLGLGLAREPPLLASSMGTGPRGPILLGLPLPAAPLQIEAALTKKVFTWVRVLFPPTFAIALESSRIPTDGCKGQKGSRGVMAHSGSSYFPDPSPLPQLPGGRRHSWGPLFSPEPHSTPNTAKSCHLWSSGS